MKLLKIILIAILIFLKHITLGQREVVITVDKRHPYLCEYSDDFLDSKIERIGKGSTNKYVISIIYPSTLKIFYEGKESLFFLIPKDSISFTKVEGSLRYKSLNRTDSLFDAFTNLEYTLGLELAFHSKYQIRDLLKSNFERLRESIFEKMNKQLGLMNRFNADEDSLRWRYMNQEIKYFTLVELLEPYHTISSDKKYWKQIPLWYADSLRNFKNSFNDELNPVGGTEHKRAIVAYNQFLSIDSLGTKNDFQILFNSAIRNFKGSQRDFLMAYLLKKFKIENPPNFYDMVGTFYSVCQDNYFIQYVKDKIDDSNFTYPDKILHTELINSEGIKTTWEQILSKHKGKLVYIDLWASWCPPCILEIPCIQNLKKQYEGENIDFISISIDHKHKSWKKAIEKHYPNASHEEHYWLGKSNRFVQFLLTRREGENTPIWIPKYLLFDEKGNIITSNAVRPCFVKETKRQLDIFLKKP